VETAPTFTALYAIHSQSPHYGNNITARKTLLQKKFIAEKWNMGNAFQKPFARCETSGVHGSSPKSNKGYGAL